MKYQFNLSLKKMLEATGGSHYKLVVLAAKRAMQLADGDKPLIDKPGEKLIDNALQEIMEGKIVLRENAAGNEE